MLAQGLNNISLSVRMPSSMAGSYARKAREPQAVEASPTGDVYTDAAYSLELSKPEVKEPADYSAKRIPPADGSSFNETWPLIKVRVPINEVIVISLKPKKALEQKQDSGTGIRSDLLAAD